MAAVPLGRHPLLFLLLAAAAAAPSPLVKKEADSAEDPAFVSEYFSQSSQTLSFYRWYGSAKIFRFRVPEDAVLLRWLLQASKGKGPGCGKTQVTFHIRYGAPPVINPLGTQFPVNTSVPPSFSQTLTLDAALQNSTFVNLTSPAAGDWFLAAHLPAASSKIEVKGFSRTCTYTFQPDLFVLRRVDVVVLEPGVPMQQALSQGARRPLHAKVFVPEYTAGLRFELGNCTENGSAAACALRVTLGSGVLSRSSQKVLPCPEACSVFLTSPPWGRWVWITVESLGGAGARVSFEMAAFFVACKPGGAGSFLGFYQSWKQDQGMPMPGGSRNSTLLAMGSAHNASGPGSSCLHGQPVVREELDVASVRFRTLGDSTVPVRGELPTLLLLDLNSGTDSGGSLVLSLVLNETSVGLGNATVWACLSPTSPALPLNGSWGCRTGWAGWSCTDGAKAQSEGTQILATLLLTLSNLLFLPAITVALYHYHLVEASVYTFTMFFSTFYHACDQPGIAVMCIMDYDTLQFCDFLGSVVSIWVTILCMARVEKILKYVLCVLGTLVIAMSLQLDRRGVWNMMGPCVFALTVMATIWVCRGVSRRRCYPPSWKRWAFFLFPGTGLALVAIAVYACLETTENYYYTHSIWHVLVASSVAFLLPPGDKQEEPWAWSRKLLCRYQICKNDREELYAVS